MGRLDPSSRPFTQNHFSCLERIDDLAFMDTPLDEGARQKHLTHALSVGYELAFLNRQNFPESSDVKDSSCH